MSRLSRLLRARTFRVTAWTASNLAISTLTGVITARSLGPDSRGTLALAISVGGLCVLLGALGTNVSVRRHLPRDSGVNLRGYLRVSALLLPPLVVILLVVAWALSALIEGDFVEPPILIAFLAFGVAYFLSNQALDLLNAQGRVAASARINATGSLICFVLIAAAAALGLGAPYMIGCYALSFLAQSVIAYRLAIGGSMLRDHQVGAGGRLLIGDGLRLLGLNLGQSLTYRADTVLIGVFSTSSQVGVYAVATTPASILRLPSNAVGQVLVHDLASGALRGRLVFKRVLLLEAILIPIAVIGWFVADWVIPFVYGPAFSEAIEPFRLLLIAELALAPFLVFSRALVGLGGTWGASIPGIIGAIVLIIACVVLVPSMGANGAALASIAAYGTMSLLSVIRFWRASGARHEPQLLGRD